MDRRIDERFRKPRRTKGTPMYYQRAYWAAGLVGSCAALWGLLELMPSTQILRETLRENLKNPKEFEQKAEHARISYENPGVASLLAKARERIAYKDEPKPDSQTRKKVSASQTPSVSKYFAKNGTQTDTLQANFKQVSDRFNDSLDDFQSPLVKRNKTNSVWKLNKDSTKSSKPAKKRKPTKNATLEIVKENFAECEANPEHLQMAIALSKSTFEAANGQNVVDEECPDIGAILQNAKPTNLERFGFKSGKSMSVANWRATRKKEEASKKSKGRFKYVTPILNIRSRADREALIDSKISLILNGPILKPKINSKLVLSSEKLQSFSVRGEGQLFCQDNLYERDYFYVSELNLSKNVSPCGALLRDWGSIPGRDKSPESTRNCLAEIKCPSGRCVSPDLFDSFDEALFLKSGTLNVGNEFKEKVIDLTSDDDSGLPKSKCADIYNLDEFEECDFKIIEQTIESDSCLRDSQNEQREKDNVACTSVKESPIELKKCSPSEDEAPLPIRDVTCIEISDDSLQGHESDEEFNRVSMPRSSRGYNSTDLNVTDYVSQLLKKPQYSFDCDPEEEKDNLLLSSSQGSQCGYVEDEELNYSCRFDTPTKSDKEKVIMNKSPDKNREKVETISTPTTNNYCLIKTENVTPMPDYDTMTTPTINVELQKVGVKPLKRPRAAKLLKYIYESTHPIVDSDDSDREGKILKKRKSDCQSELVQQLDIVGDEILINEDPEDLIFERNKSGKTATCRVPLQIVWHNFLCQNPDIRERILLYEPLQLEMIHMALKKIGFKFHAQDLLTFLDKKCVTVRTAQKKTKK